MLFRLQGQIANALDLLVKARDRYESLRDERTLAGVLIELGFVLFRKGEYTDAQKQLERGLGLARTAGDSRSVALALNNLGIVSVDQANAPKRRPFMMRAWCCSVNSAKRWALLLAQQPWHCTILSW